MTAIHGASPRQVLADVQCTRLKFEPGDRILVRVKMPLDDERTRKLKKTVEKWSGGVCEVLIINETMASIEVQKSPKVLSGV